MTTRQRVIISLAGSVLLAVMFFIVFSENGLVDLNRLQQEHALLVEKNRRLGHENRNLGVEIGRLKNDPSYVEQIARRKLGMVGADEIVIKTDRAGDGKP